MGRRCCSRTRPDLAALPIRYGRASRIGGTAAAELQRLSERLHGLLDLTAPSYQQGRRADPTVLRQVLRGENLRRKPLWLRAEGDSDPAANPDARGRAAAGAARRAARRHRRAAGDGGAWRGGPFSICPRTCDGRRSRRLHRRPLSDARPVLVDALRLPVAAAGGTRRRGSWWRLADRDSVPYLVTLLKEATPLAPSQWARNAGRCAKSWPCATSTTA